MKTLTREVKEFIVDYIKKADFDLDIFKDKEMIVENVIEILIENKLIPEKPSDRDDNEELLDFIRSLL